MQRHSIWLAAGAGLLLSGAMRADIIIGFSEEMGPSMAHYTDQVHSSNRGIPADTRFQVDKFVHNVSGFDWVNPGGWFAYTVNIQVLSDGTWFNSTAADSIAFDFTDLASFDAWRNQVRVDINSVFLTYGTDWDVVPAPLLGQGVNDRVAFLIRPTVAVGDTLSLHFDMYEAADSIWRLEQAVPEPGSLVLIGLGLVAAGLARRRH